MFDPNNIVNIADIKEEASYKEQRGKLKADCQAALGALVYTLSDGRKIQCRPQDAQNIQLRINEGVDSEWILADNTVATVTCAELQEAFNYGVTQGEAIYATYREGLKAL